MSQNFDDEFFQDPSPDPADKNWTGWIFSGLLTVAVISLAGYWFLGTASTETPTVVSDGGIPLLKADPSPTKHRPEKAGGIQVPFQDKLVYERVEKGAIIKVKERLLPNPEEPLKAGERFQKLLTQSRREEKEREQAKKVLLPKKSSDTLAADQAEAEKKSKIARLIEEKQAQAAAKEKAEKATDTEIKKPATKPATAAAKQPDKKKTVAAKKVPEKKPAQKPTIKSKPKITAKPDKKKAPEKVVVTKKPNKPVKVAAKTPPKKPVVKKVLEKKVVAKKPAVTGN